jgi:glycerate kinase
VVIAPDSFKGSFTAEEAARAMARGVREAVDSAEIVLAPMADGGEGSLAGILRLARGQQIIVNSVDSYGTPIQASYGVRENTAWVEMAQSGGLHFLPHASSGLLRNQLALKASTYGTGILIRHAILCGHTLIYLMLGGSGTTDGGFGLLSALGAQYHDAQGKVLDGRDSRQLAQLDKISALEAVARLVQPVSFVVAADVANPLCGPGGAAFTYGPQKGLNPGGVRERDGELMRWADLLLAAAGAKDSSLKDQPGTGAAGGTAFPLALMAPAMRWVAGAEFMAEACGLEYAIARADAVLTGEGATDAQTFSGKVPYTVLRLCARYQKPCAVVSGRLDDGYEKLRELGPVHFEQATPRGADFSGVEQWGQQWIADAAKRAMVKILSE